MGVEFRLGRQDAQKAEDFLARRPDGVSGIILDTAYARYQLDAADAARDAGMNVLYDPATERMADRGFEPAGVGFHGGGPFDIELPARDGSARTRLVEGVLTRALGSDDHRDAAALPRARSPLLGAECRPRGETAHLTSKPVRAALVINRKLAEETASGLAAEYYAAAIRAVDLRVTPLGGENESVKKAQSVFAFADAFARRWQ